MRIWRKLKQKCRVLLHRHKFKRFGKSVITGKIHIRCGKDVEVGDGCVFNEGVLLSGGGGIKIGDKVHFSPQSSAITGWLDQDRRHHSEPIEIKDNVWIASGAVISHGVTVGENSIIGANAVVVSDVPPDSFYAGVPAHSQKTQG